MDALLGALAGRTMLMRDREGRPLGEHKAGAERMQGIATELRTCPYRGSRYHHALPMNVSALRQVTAHWAEVLGGLAYLRDLHHAWAGPATVRLIDVWRVGHLTSCIADFAFARTWNAYDDGELHMRGFDGFSQLFGEAVNKIRVNTVFTVAGKLLTG